MIYNFDERIDRRNTFCTKWENFKRIGNPNALPMWIADTDFPCCEAVLRAVREESLSPRYDKAAVDPELFRVTAKWMYRHYRWAAEERQMLFAPGVIPALNAAIQALSAPGDGVIIQQPAYGTFTRSVLGNGRKVCANNMNLINGRYMPDFEELERLSSKKDTKLLIFCNPHNPTGRSFTHEELVRIVEICAKCNITILSDEIHADLVYEGAGHIPVASLSPEAALRTVTFTSPSKVFNIAGLRAAVTTAANPILYRRLKAQLKCNGADIPNPYGNAAYIAAYTGGEEYLRQMKLYLKGNIDYLDRYLRAKMPRIKLIYPDATFITWLDCRELHMDFIDLEDFMLNRCLVATSPGSSFGEAGKGFFRFNIGFPRSLVSTALDQICGQYQLLPCAT